MKLLDLSPLLAGAPGDSIRVAGLTLGGAAGDVDRAQLTGAEDDDSNEPRTYMRGSVFRDGPDGELVEVPLSERVAATLKRGGCVRCGEVAIRIKHGVVEAIFVRGPALASLGIRVEADIERLLGTPAGTRWCLGNRERHYPERALIVVWNTEGNRLDYVALKATSWKEPRLGARDLLAEILDCFDVGTRQRWQEPSEPGLARLHHQRASALARALDLGSLANVANAEFLNNPLSVERRQVLAEIAAVGPRAGETSHSAPMVFLHLLHYRRDVNVVVHATRGWLECSDSALLGMITVQGRIASGLTGLMVDVDRWLVALLDPLERTFELRTLIAAHGWPDVDLYAVERDEVW